MTTPYDAFNVSYRKLRAGWNYENLGLRCIWGPRDELLISAAAVLPEVHKEQ